MLQSVIEATGTTAFAIIALLLSVLAFAAVIVAVLIRRQSEVNRQARLPLEDDHLDELEPEGR
jgi:cbb3-type cytochrome oxidase subunit 3